MAFDPSSRRTKRDEPPKPPTTQTDPSLTQLQMNPFEPQHLGGPMAMPDMPPPSSVYGMAAPTPPPPDLSGMTDALGGIRSSGSPTPSPGAAGGSFGPQDAMMAAYLTAMLGGTAGTLLKPMPPPPPIAVPQSNPNPITANAAMQSSLGLAQNRKQRTPHQFGRGGA